MQIFKNLLLACAIAAPSIPLSLLAEDNAAQAAARAALQQKMREMNSVSAVATPPPTTTHSPAPAPARPAPVREPMMETPRVVPMAAPAASGASSDLIEQARQATRARMTELQSNPQTSIPAGRETPAPQSATMMPAEVAPGIPAYTPAPNPKEEARASKEREAAAKRAAAAERAAAKKAAQEQAAMAKAAAKKASEKPVFAEPTPTPPDEVKVMVDREIQTPPPIVAEEKKSEKNSKAAKPAAKTSRKPVEAPVVFTPLEGPASSLPGSKAERLQQLTDKYRADSISAEEYHQQRAKILGEP